MGREIRKSLVKMFIIILFWLSIGFLNVPLLRQIITTSSILEIEVKEVDTLEEFEHFSFDAVKPPSIEDIVSTEELDQPSIGKLSIPSVDIVEPVFAGLDQTAMAVGVGSMYPEREVLESNIVILGHNLEMPERIFANLDKVRQGDMVELKYLGEYYSYRIRNKETVKEDRLEVLSKEPKKQLTLITCDTATSVTDNRVVVTAELMEERKVSSEIFLSQASRKESLKSDKLKKLRRNLLSVLKVNIAIAITSTYFIYRKLEF